MTMVGAVCQQEAIASHHHRLGIFLVQQAMPGVLDVGIGACEWVRCVHPRLLPHLGQDLSVVAMASCFRQHVSRQDVASRLLH